MPERKKPASSRRTGSPARSGLRKPPRRATSVSGSARRAPEPRKKAAPRKPSLRRKPVQETPDVSAFDEEALLEPAVTGETAEEARPEFGPVAIAGQTPAGEVAAAAFGETSYPGAPGLLPERTDDMPVPEETDRAERYPQDWLVAALSLLLGAAVFLPWYSFQYQGKSITLSGWETGTWGPLVLFLGLGSLGLAVTRLANLRVSLPLPHPTVHEGVGWIAIFAVLLKRLLRPDIPSPFGGAATGKVGQTWWILAPIVLGLVLAFIAGRMTSGPPLIVIPGWIRGRAGKIGLALILIVALGGAGLGYLNASSLDKTIAAKQNSAIGAPPGSRPQGGTGSQFKPLLNQFPKCASSIPTPPGAKPETAVEQSATTPCIWVMHSNTKPPGILDFYKTEMPKSGYTVGVAQSNAAGSTLTFRGSKCGNISISQAQQGKTGSRIAVYLAPCTALSPRPTSSPK